MTTADDASPDVINVAAEVLRDWIDFRSREFERYSKRESTIYSERERTIARLLHNAPILARAVERLEEQA